MVNYFTIAYKLKTHDLSGNVSDFDKITSTYLANEIATSKEEAVSKLKTDFSMLDIEVLSVSGMKSVSDEEFAAMRT